MNGAVQRRRATMGAKQSRLPPAYQEVEWIGSNGYQSVKPVPIDTGYVPKVAPRAVLRIIQYETGNYSIFVTDTNAPHNFRLYGGLQYYRYGSSSNTQGFAGYEASTWYTVDAGQNLYVDGELIITKSAGDWSENTASFVVWGGVNQNYYSHIAFLKLYDGDALVRDLVPCYRKSDGRIGFYDLVGNQFYTNNGSNGYLAKGDDVK